MTQPASPAMMTIMAGGSTGVGRHNNPASELIYLSEGNRGNSSWFFPTIDKWVAANPPPPPPLPQGGLAGGTGPGVPAGEMPDQGAAGQIIGGEGGRAGVRVSESGTAENPAQAISYVTGSGQAAALGSWGDVPGPDWDTPGPGTGGWFFGGSEAAMAMGATGDGTGSTLLSEKDYEDMAEEQEETNPTPGADGIYLGAVRGPDMEQRGWDPLVGSNLENPHPLSMSPFATLTRAASGIRDFGSGQPDFT